MKRFGQIAIVLTFDANKISFQEATEKAQKVQKMLDGWIEVNGGQEPQGYAGPPFVDNRYDDRW